MQTISLSFFHRKIGPIVIFAYPEGNLDEMAKLRIADIMDQAFEEGFFTHSFGELTSMNYYFEIFSSWARGSKEMVMVSVVFDEDVPSDLEHVLLSYTIDFATKLKNNMEIYKGFYISDEENYGEEERANIREMHEELELWVKELYWATLEETREKEPEEKIAALLRNEDVFFTIEKLAKGPMLLTDLKDWYNGQFPHLDFTKFMEKIEDEKFVFVNEIGQDTYVLLVKEPRIGRIPPDCVIPLIEENPDNMDLLDIYIEEVRIFFDNYTPTAEDSLKLMDLLSNPKMYNVLMQLRKGPLQREKLAEVVTEKSLKSLLDILTVMQEFKIIEEFQFNGENLLILLTDVRFTTAFPEYLAKLLPGKNEIQSRSTKSGKKRKKGKSNLLEEQNTPEDLEKEDNGESKSDAAKVIQDDDIDPRKLFNGEFI